MVAVAGGLIIGDGQAQGVCWETIPVNPDSCAVIRSSCLVKTTEYNYLARSY
jgi:hypothetical protein